MPHLQSARKVRWAAHTLSQMLDSRARHCAPLHTLVIQPFEHAPADMPEDPEDAGRWFEETTRPLRSLETYVDEVKVVGVGEDVFGAVDGAL